MAYRSKFRVLSRLTPSVRMVGLFLLLVFTGRPAHAQCPDGSPPPCRAASRPRPTVAWQSVAILPFENRTRDTTIQWLAEGLADEIATNLGRIERLRTSSPSAVRSALTRGSRDPKQLSSTLGVRWLLDGQLLAGGGSIRLGAQLVDASRGTIRWAGAIERPSSDLLGVMRTVADSVAAAIVGSLAPGELARFEMRPTSSAEAYEAYIRGRAALLPGAGQNLYRASAFFEMATTTDPQFADAWAAQASTAVSMADNLLSPRVAHTQARRFAERALQIDPANGEATAALAKITLWYDWDLPGAVLLARRATALAPASADAQLVYGLALVARGDTAAATSALLRAIDLDSLSGRTINNAALGLMFLGAYPAMEQRARRIMATAANVFGTRLMVYSLESRGACTESRPLRATLPEATVNSVNLCAAPTAEGRERVKKEAAEARTTRPYFRAWTYARLYALLGLTDDSLALLKQGLLDREAFMPFIQMDPGFRSLFNDPRFHTIVQQVRAAAGAP